MGSKKFWEILLILNVVLFALNLVQHLPIAALFQGFMIAWCYYEATR